jgi:hypothetical protein
MDRDKALTLLKGGPAGRARWQAFRRSGGQPPELNGAHLHHVNLEGLDLSHCSLQRVDFSGARLTRTNFQSAYAPTADFSGADLVGANLQKANLDSCQFNSANLIAADLRDSILSRTSFSRASLVSANLSGSYLVDADLSDVALRRTNVTAAEFGYTVLAANISMTIGLDKIIHKAPSHVSLETILSCQGKLPVKFLRGCGVDEQDIEYFRNRVNEPSTYCSCFISYSHHDKSFAHKLYNRLQENGVRCWLDNHQLLPGDDIYDEIDQGIKSWDKVLLCCSKASLAGSPWVDREIDKALQKEETLWHQLNAKSLSLIPLNLDDYLYKWNSGKASILKSRLAADFRNWQTDAESFDKALDKILTALRVK